MNKFLNISSLFLIIIYLTTTISVTPPASYTIGVSSMIRSGTKSSPNKKFLAAILMAIDEINNKNDGVLDDLLPATTFRFYFREDINDFTYGTLNAYFNLIYAPTTIAVIGPLTTPSGQGTLPVYAASNVPVIGHSDRSPYFSDSLYYPNYLRTVPGFYLDGQAAASLIAQYFQWDKVSVFYTNTQAGRTSAQVFRYYAEKYNVEIFSYHNLDSSRNNLIPSINAAKKFGSRIFVLFTEVDIAFDLIEKGNEMKLFSSQTQIIGGELLSNENSWNSLNTTSLQLNKLLKGFISVKYNHEIPSSDLKEAFISRWLARPNTNGSNTVPPVCNTRKDSFNSGYIHQFSVPGGRGSPIPGSPQPTGTCSGVDFSSYKSLPNLEHELDDVMYAYDSVLAVAYGLHHLIYDQNTLPTPSKLNQLLLKNFSFTGLTGDVSFMTTMGDESFDIGGRVTNIRYDILNYIPIENADTVDRNITFQSIIQWHSENGFTNCLSESSLSYIDPTIDSICQNFQFASTDNTVPIDSPSPNEKGTPPWINEALTSISLIGLILTFLVITIIFSFRHRRLVKMSQPTISNIKKLGIILGFIRVLLYAMETKAQICYGRLWLEHIAFQLIFSSIFFRSWRVYLVTCAMKRVKVTDSQCIFLIFLSILVTIAILIAVTASGVTLNQVVIVDDQFNYNFQKTCQYNNQSVLLLMYIYDLLILVLSLIICWLIRKVNSIISNTRALVEGLLLTSFAIVGLSLLVALGNLTPSSEQFILGLVLALILLRLLWLFESKMIYNLFTGYELDRSLILRKSEKNILQLFGFNQLSHKIFAADDYEPSGQSGCSGSLGSPNTISNFNNSKSSAQQSKILKKYSKLKLNELIANLNLIKEDIELKQIELSSLENLIFLASQDDNSTNNNNSSGGPQNNKSSSHRNHSNHSESGNNDDIEDPDILKCNIPLSPSEKNDALSTELSTNQMNQNISTLLSSNDKFVQLKQFIFHTKNSTFFIERLLK